MGQLLIWMSLLACSDIKYKDQFISVCNDIMPFRLLFLWMNVGHKIFMVYKEYFLNIAAKIKMKERLGYAKPQCYDQ